MHTAILAPTFSQTPAVYIVHLISDAALGDGTWNVAHKRDTIICNVIYTRQAWRVTVCAGALGGREVKWCRDQVFKPTNTRQTVARMHVQSDQTHFHCLKFALGHFY